MPSFDRHSTDIFRSAKDLPEHVVRHLLNDQRNANIILPYILSERKAGASNEHDVWVVSSTIQSDGTPILNFVSALTKGSVDFLPLFIYHGRPLEGLAPMFLQDRMQELARTLTRDAQIPIERIFSVFAAEPVTRAFFHAWTSLTGVQEDAGDETVSSEYYAALLTYCDPKSFPRSRTMTIDPDRQYNIRKATIEDLSQATSLCHGFAALSAPFVLTQEKAALEAQKYISKGQLWVLEVTSQVGPSGIASICAVTRTTARVAGITKVYTNPQFRKMGCALRLVRAVCDHYFSKEGKESLVLYVAHDNAAARRTYKSVGFHGLEDSKGYVPGVERWLEIGFDRQVVRLGHW